MAAMNTAAKAAVSRNAEARSSLFRCTQGVPGAAHRVDQLRPALVDLAAQPADVALDDVGLRIEMKIPDVLQKHGPRHHATGVAHQVLEQLELARLEVDARAGARHRALDQVELEIGDAQHGLG